MDINVLRALYMTQPAEVSIETLALCNARCTFCPYPTLERIGTEMPMSMIDAMLEEMSGWREPFHISPFKVNEPLLDKRLPTICRAIVDIIPRATIRLFTNGSALTPDAIAWIAALPQGRLAHLWVSLNSTDPDEYKSLMGLSFEQTARRLDALHDAARDGDFLHPVILSRVEQNNATWDMNRRFFDDTNHRWPRFVSTIIKRDGWIGYVKPSSEAIPARPCGRWFELSILATGVASLCCMDGKGEYPVGDVKYQSLYQIYNNPRLRNWREFANRRTGINPCERCTY